MSEVFFTPVTSGWRTATSAATLQAVATIASKAAYTATTNTVNTVSWEYVIFSIAYTKGDETSLRMKVEGYDGTSWQPALFVDTQSASYSPVTADLLEASATVSGALPPVSCLGFQAMRMSFVANGGTPTGTIGCTATAGITVKH